MKFGSSNPHKGVAESGIGQFADALKDNMQAIVGVGEAIADHLDQFIDVEYEIDSTAADVLTGAAETIFLDGDIEEGIGELKFLQLKTITVNVPWAEQTPNLDLKGRLGLVVSGISPTEVGGTGVSGGLQITGKLGGYNVGAGVSGSAVYNFNTDEFDPQLSNVGIQVQTVFP